MKVLISSWITICGALCAFHVRNVVCNTQDICRRDPPDTEASKTPGDNGFRIKLAGRPQPERYTPERVYTVSINGTYPNQRLRGFMLVAVPLNAQDESSAIGTFQHLNSGLTKFAEACYWVVQHTYEHKRAGVEVLWTAPPAGTGCIEFRATVIEYKDIWYKDDGALTRVFCEDSGTTENDQAAALLPECCACGSAKYEVVFHGLWSRQTHPKDYPQHQALLHWSNIVGASHNKQYVPWQYGAYASAGVKEVCEFGYPRKMEDEMRQHSHDVRTVIKTPGIWWKDPDGLLQKRWARFSVDRKHHLLTMISMIGPSPDWCVGVSALNLCLPNCTWSGNQFVDLYPFDAGTDDGVSFMSANQKSDPPQKLHRITNTFPKNPASPFYGSEPIRPLARLELKRLHPKPGSTVVCTDGDEDLQDYDDDDDDGGAFGGSEQGDMDLLNDMEKQKLMMMQSGKCALSDWIKWSECSVTCGVGKKIRKRMYLNPMVDEDMCGQPTMEAENCIGIENECGEVAPGCEATHWSDWSPCSVTCGTGVQDRRRYYLNKAARDEAGCDRVMDEQQVCVAEIPDCNKALMMKNFTAICSQPRSDGSCRGSFERWHYDPDMRKCLPFDYSGCRGNENRFRTQRECEEMCVERVFDFNGGFEEPNIGAQLGSDVSDMELQKQMMMKQLLMEQQQEAERREMEKQRAMQRVTDPVDCMMTPWTSWSTCSATCGRSFKYKRRMQKRAPENGGKKCPKRLEKKKKCDVPKCALDCELGPWSEWTPCLHTCLQERTRQVLHRARRGGHECGARLSRRHCNEYPCQQPPTTTTEEEEKKKRARRRRRRH